MSYFLYSRTARAVENRYSLLEYAIYARKSRVDMEAESRGEGETLSRHINTLSELANRRNLKVGRIYKEIVSGETISSRPVMQQLLSDVEQGMWAGVLVMEVERLARGDTIDQGIVAQTFRYSGTKIITPLKDYDPNNEFDEEYFEFGLFMSRREYKTINRRLQRGRDASVHEGKYIGNIPPYGYDRQKIVGDKGFTLVPNPAEADVVKLIFDLYTSGIEQADGSIKKYGVALIANHLNGLRIKPRKGDGWSIATIRGILNNPTYIGKIPYKRRATVKSMSNGKLEKVRPRNFDFEIYDGMHDPIIDVDIFNKAMEITKNNHLPKVRQSMEMKNPICGLIVCGNCGRNLIRRPYNTGYPDSLYCPAQNCHNVSSLLHVVEKRLLDSLRDWVNEYSLSIEGQNETKVKSEEKEIKKKSLQGMIQERYTLQSQLDNMHDLLEKGIYSVDTFLTRSQKIKDALNKIEQDIDELKKSISADERYLEQRTSFIPKVKRLLEVYDELPSPKAKNDMLREVIDKAVYVKTERSRRKGNPDNFDLTLYPHIPEESK